MELRTPYKIYELSRRNHFDTGADIIRVFEKSC